MFYTPSNSIHLIFTGYQVDFDHLDEIEKQLDIENDLDVIITSDFRYFVGNRIISNSYLNLVEFQLDLLRDYSTKDSIRKLRFKLMELWPEKYKNVYPKLFLVSI